MKVEASPNNWRKVAELLDCMAALSGDGTPYERIAESFAAQIKEGIYREIAERGEEAVFAEMHAEERG